LKENTAMTNDEFNKYICSTGASFHHVGFVVRDNDKIMDAFNKIPGFGDWFTDESVWTDENMVVGPKNAIRCSKAKIFDEILVELVQPQAGKADGTHFENYLAKQGDSMHHFAYAIPKHEDFLKIREQMMADGCEDVHHGKLLHDDGSLFVEFCYLKVPEGGVYIELNYSNPK